MNVYLFQNPMQSTEWLSLEGSKFKDALSFPWKFVQDPKEANVIVWDGFVSPKLAHRKTEIMEMLIPRKILICNGAIDSEDFESVQKVILPGITNRPEELLGALVECFERLKNV
jgi:Ni,Fe-hydrogenase III small subunit